MFNKLTSKVRKPGEKYYIGTMRRMKALGCLAMLFLLIHPFPAYPALPEWEIEEVITGDIDTVLRGGCAWRLIAVDSNCRPHTFYRDTTQKLIKHAYRDASGWHIETAFTEDPMDAGLYKGQIAIDSMDHPGMTICTITPGAFMQRKYVHWTGSSWEVMNICESDIGRGHNAPSLAFDSNDNPHGVNYAHVGMTINHRSHHTWYDGEWHTEVVPSQRELRRSDIAIASNDVIHLGYFDTVQDKNNPTVQKLAYLKKEGDAWSTYTHIKEFTPWVLQEGIGGKGAIGVAIDSADRPHMVYCHRHTEDSEDVIKLYYCRYTGTEWIDEIIDPDIGAASSSPNLSVPVIDGEDYIHFVYRAASGEIKYVRRDTKSLGSGWEITTLASGGSSLSIAVDTEDKRHVVYEKVSTGELIYLCYKDTDNDGLLDDWEYHYFGDLSHSSEEDYEPDGLANLQECRYNTDPTNPDTDSDGMPDGWEVDNNLNPSFNDANENPDGDDYTNIQEYQQGTDPHAYTEFLPYETGFEPGEGFSLGNLHNQKGWQVTGGTAIVETNTVHSGAQAVTSPGRIHKSFTGTNDNIQWMDLYLQPVAAEKPQEIPSTLQSSIIYVDLNSEIICLNGNGDGTGQWLSTGVSVTSNTWHRITIRQDYNTHTWRIYVNGGLTPKLSNLGFKDNISSLNAFSIKDACLDTLYFGKDGDLDSDGLPDDWEQEYFGNLDQGPDDDPDNDGLTNVGEHQHNTNPVNPDTDSDNMPDGWEVDKGLNPLVNDANLDPDSDGQSNYNEYVANTDPLSATSLFKMTEAKQNAGNANYLDISWTFVEGKEYTIYYSNDPYSDTMTWDEVTGPTIITNAATLTWTDNGTLTGGVPPGEAEHRYYKVKVE